MFLTLCFVILYYNIDNIIQTCYIPLFTNANNVEIDLQNNLFLFSLKSTSIFMIGLYLYQMIMYLIYSNSINKSSIGLSYVYIKYLIDIIITNNKSMIEYETRRTIMWVFTTPLMLKMYCETNDLTIWDINIHYHIISITPLIFLVPLKSWEYYNFFIFLLYIPECFFLKKLYQYKNLPFTHMFLYFWSIFMIINVLDITNICNKIYIHTFYNIADTLCKFICNFVISYHNQQEAYVINNMDLQSVNFVSYVIKHIKQYEIEHKNLTPFCNNLIKYCTKKFVEKIPKSNQALKLELLKKLLPFDFDKDYINANANANAKVNAKVKVNVNAKTFDKIVILFMDIANYTELAKQYDCDVIFNLLNNIYNKFDNIIKQYSNLQKIETIGDAYMVVGEIYGNNQNIEMDVKEIIVLATDFLKEIKHIETPDNIKLCIRIGINIGSVNIGILGNEIPRLCVVGNSVNIASRLQSTCDIDCIQISESVYEIIKDTSFENDIIFHKKENVFLKNIGSVNTYNYIKK